MHSSAVAVLALVTSALAAAATPLSFGEKAFPKRVFTVQPRSADPNPLSGLAGIITAGCEKTCLPFVHGMSSCTQYTDTREGDCACSKTNIRHLKDCAACIAQDKTATSAVQGEALDNYNAWTSNCTKSGYGSSPSKTSSKSSSAVSTSTLLAPLTTSGLASGASRNSTASAISTASRPAPLTTSTGSSSGVSSSSPSSASATSNAASVAVRGGVVVVGTLVAAIAAELRL